jgi:hypothetical protein
MAFTTIDDPSAYFNTKLYTGNGSSGTALTTGTFQPDFCWFKNRGTAENSVLINAINGASFNLSSNLNRAETDVSAKVSAFTSTGVTLGSNAETNENSQPLVAWTWKANGSGSANTVGVIDSTVSVNATSGFTIVKWVATDENTTIGHGLGVAPKVIIVKSTTVTQPWIMGHGSLGFTKNLYLNQTDAENTSSTMWVNTAPTSTVFTTGTNDNVAQNGETFIAYCFSEVQGFSKFGSYIGNGNADGPFIHTGFKPAFLLIKNATDTENWYILDNKRPGYNTNNYYILPSTAGAEGTSTTLATSLLSNGFKINNADTSMNTSGKTYVYMAFAESPFVTSTGIPTTAR